MEERDAEREHSIRVTKENAKRATRALKVIKANPDLNWFYFERLQFEIEASDEKIHMILSGKGGDLLSLQRLQAEIDIREDLMNDPANRIAKEKDMRRVLKEEKKLEE